MKKYSKPIILKIHEFRPSMICASGGAQESMLYSNSESSVNVEEEQDDNGNLLHFICE